MAPTFNSRGLRVLFPILFLLIVPICWGQDPPLRIVDLTHPFSESSVYWPTAEGFSLHVDADGETEKGYYYSANSFAAAEHGGTHLDAPIHFAKGMPSVDEIHLRRLIAPGIVIDLEEKIKQDADYQITEDDIKAWEETHGKIGEGHILLFRTGWERYYGNPAKYLGTDQKGAEAVAELHFPGLHPKAAEWLVRERSIAAVGLDTPSIDYGQSELFESHQILFRAAVPAFENVAGLTNLPPKGFEIIALPMKIEGGSGAPLRIVAVFR